MSTQMKKKKSKSTFQTSWTNKKLHPDWSDNFLRPVKGDSSSAHCAWCNRNFSVSTMGVQAVHSHVKSSGHQKASFVMRDQTRLLNPSDTAELPQESAQTSSAAERESFRPSSSVTMSATLDNSVSRDDVLAAELLWITHTIRGGHSYRSTDGIGETFREMFPDSEVAKKFSLGRDKASYLACYGIAPFHKKDLFMTSAIRIITPFVLTSL